MVEEARTRVYPLHAIGKDVGVVLPRHAQPIGLLDRAVGVQVIPTIARVGDDGMGPDDLEEKRHQGETRELSQHPVVV